MIDSLLVKSLAAVDYKLQLENHGMVSRDLGEPSFDPICNLIKKENLADNLTKRDLTLINKRHAERERVAKKAKKEEGERVAKKAKGEGSKKRARE